MANKPHRCYFWAVNFGQRLNSKEIFPPFAWQLSHLKGTVRKIVLLFSLLFIKYEFQNVAIYAAT